MTNAMRDTSPRVLWEQLRESVASRDELRRRLDEARRLRPTVPDTAELSRLAQPLIDRLAAARSEIPMPETPAFLRDGVDRINVALGRKKRSPLERFFGSPTPLWLTVALGIGAFFAGMAVAQATHASRARTVRPEQLEAAADQIKENWPSVHDDDIRDARGNLKRLSSVVAERTGEDQRAVRERLTAITSGQSSNGHS